MSTLAGWRARLCADVEDAEAQDMLRISPHGCYEWLLRMASALLLGFESDLSTYYSDCWCAGILPRLVVRAGVSGFDDSIGRTMLHVFACLEIEPHKLTQ